MWQSDWRVSVAVKRFAVIKAVILGYRPILDKVIEMDNKAKEFNRTICAHCMNDAQLEFDFTMAFQPIVNCRTHEVFGYEALIRGVNGESAGSIISQVNEGNRYVFDQFCRVKAITLAYQLGLDSVLSINFLPNAIYQPERCLRTTLDAAREFGFPIEKIMFEFTEVERIDDSEHVKNIVECYHALGFRTAIDDFGAGYSGLGLLADFQTNVVKLDMALIRCIEKDRIRQSIVQNCLNIFSDIGITPLAEGVETPEERSWLQEAGVELMQGYLFARPGFECLPEVSAASW
ncbi:EAL domain-containing protein [Hahella ganghwensis]|uniref:EAL domain-containing protein n=1 Tax=Hahella ganghwensis TaxID=286420 RepID=UPI0003A7324E|nr:EAL domain-containing protein [Hahella ganghwensis]